jgi:hypothetical protein
MLSSSDAGLPQARQSPNGTNRKQDYVIASGRESA